MLDVLPGVAPCKMPCTKGRCLCDGAVWLQTLPRLRDPGLWCLLSVSPLQVGKQHKTSMTHPRINTLTGLAPSHSPKHDVQTVTHTTGL